MTANLQRALRLLEGGYPRVQWAGGGSPQGTGLWSFRGDDGGGGGDDSGGLRDKLYVHSFGRNHDVHV